MGWFETESGSTIGDEPADALSDALDGALEDGLREIVSIYQTRLRRSPTEAEIKETLSFVARPAIEQALSDCGKWRRPFIAVAFDASTTAVGICVTHDGQVVSVDLFVPRSSDPWYWRVNRIETKVGLLIGELEPDVVFYEIPTGDRHNMATNRKLGSAEFVILKQARSYEIRCVGVTATEVKATGVSKDDIEIARAMIGRDVSGDEADAIGVAIAGHKRLSIERLEAKALGVAVKESST